MHNFQLAIKRILDVSVCFAILVLGLPFFLLMGFLVKISSPGPLFFVQPRVGKDEKIFRMIKFRTMKGNPDPHTTRWTMKDEERITSIGRFLRDYGLDELPQVVNIIKGDMSIIGPRPALPQQVVAFPPELRRMFDMRPGVLSLAAIKGRRSLTMQERYMLHVKYVNIWSLKLDLKILWQSLFVVLGRVSATEKMDA